MMWLGNYSAFVQNGNAWKGILAAIPHDPAAIFAYVLLAGFIYVIWLGLRGDSADDDTARGAPPGSEATVNERDAGTGDLRSSEHGQEGD